MKPCSSRWLICFSSSLLPFLLYSFSAAAQQPKVLAPHDPVPPRATRAVPLPAAKPSSIVGGPWMVDANFRSTIQIKNDVETSAVSISPILYVSSGAKYTLPDVRLDPAGVAIVDVNAALQNLGIAPSSTLSGYVELRYNWPWVPICATIRDVDTTHSLMLYYGFLPTAPIQMPNQPPPPAGPRTSVVEGMWWKQESHVTGFVSITNSNDQPVSAELNVSDNQGLGIASHAITISPHATTQISLDELTGTSALSGGLRLTYTGGTSPVLVNGGLEDQSVGYSAVIPFTLPPQASAGSNGTVAELGLMTGPVDPMLRFPAGTVFTPYTVLRNISTVPLTTTPTLWWMAGGVARSAQLSPVTLAPYQSRTLDVPAGLAAAGLKSLAGSVNLVFAVQGVPGGLLVAGGAVDQSENYVFAVLPKWVTPSASKSLSYWSVANGDDTMVTLWNPADEAQDFIFRLDFQGGQYRFPIHLDARATQMFNVSDIVSSQVPDDQGNVIPAGVQEGSAVLMGTQDEVQHILVASDSSVYNVKKATCLYSCETCNGVQSASVQPSPWTVAVFGTTQMSLTETYNTGGNYNATGQSSWSTSDGSIASVDNSGIVTGTSGGSASITAVDNYSEPGYTGNQCGYNMPSCPLFSLNPNGSANGTVTYSLVYLSQTGCQTNNGTLVLNGTWGTQQQGGNCQLTSQVGQDSNPNADNGHCFVGGTTHWGDQMLCISTSANGCQIITCPIGDRHVNSDCSNFTDQSPSIVTFNPAGCHQ